MRALRASIPVVLAALAALALVACRSTPIIFGGGGGGGGGAAGVVVDDVELSVAIPGGRAAKLGALAARPAGLALAGPTVVVVPGAGDVSRRGKRIGDGARAYPRDVDVTLRLVEALAKSGYRAVSYDKRTCTPQSDPLCRKNPTGDVDLEGPQALSKDVDAACALARARPGADGRIILWAHGQAAQVALSSSCALSATAIVLVAPIPRTVDDVIVDGLAARSAAAKAAAKQATHPAIRARLEEESLELKNKAASQKRTFESMAKGQFEKTARVQGATLAFWTEWIELTGRTAALLDAADRPLVVVLGARDAQYAEADKDRIRALGKRPNARFVELDRADHHLLVDGALDEAALRPVLDALDKALSGPTS